MLTLAAMHVLNDSSDPFFTRLQAGAFPAKKPNGNPCDAAFNCHSGSGLSTGAKVALGVSLSIIGITIVAAGMWYYCRRKARHNIY
jgi:endoglucanase